MKQGDHIVYNTGTFVFERKFSKYILPRSVCMGTFYTLGPITSFTAKSSKELTEAEWKEMIGERIDLDLFSLEISENGISGEIKEEIFKENIHGMYEVLRNMSYPLLNGNIDYYEESYGDDLKEQSDEYAALYVKSPKDEKITINCNFAMMFLEGKVSVEEFYTEPQFINWLFKNSNIENPLKGCMVSEIVG